MSFHKGRHGLATGLDDGAEQFYAVIEYGNHHLYISRTERVTVKLGIRHHYNKNY